MGFFEVGLVMDEFFLELSFIEDKCWELVNDSVVELFSSVEFWHGRLKMVGEEGL